MLQEMDYTFSDDKKRKLNEGGCNGVSGMTHDDIKKLLEPLSKEQLLELLVNAGTRYSGVADEIRETASKDPAHRKLFVRGLAWETTSQALRDAFAEFGEIEEGAVITDKATGKSRGFGFITFKHMDSSQRALREPSKKIDGRITVCNLAAAGTLGGSQTGGGGDQTQRKLYIGGLSYETSTETLLNIFGHFGEIEEGSVAYDKTTGKSRGFGFVTYKTIEGANRALSEPTRNIDGRTVHCKLAAEGQAQKAAAAAVAAAAAAAVATPTGPGMQGFGAGVPGFGRPQAPTAPMAAMAAYSNPAMAAYGAQAAAAAAASYSLSTPQAYPSAPQYTAAQYAQYAAQFQNPQVGNTAGSAGASVSVPYYAGASG